MLNSTAFTKHAWCIPVFPVYLVIYGVLLLLNTCHIAKGEHFAGVQGLEVRDKARVRSHRNGFFQLTNKPTEVRKNP